MQKKQDFSDLQVMGTPSNLNSKFRGTGGSNRFLNLVCSSLAQKKTTKKQKVKKTGIFEPAP